MSDKEPAYISRIDETPLGPIWLGATERGLAAVSLWDDAQRFEAEVRRLTGRQTRLDPSRLATIVDELLGYLSKERIAFETKIDWSVLSPFQELVLREVCAIPYGQLSTYGEISRRIRKPRAVRAVGRANATNPIPIVIPCHRVIGADGKLHGYGAPGGLETKAWLLRLEGSWLL